MPVEFPSPMLPAASRSEVFLGDLDYFRAVLIGKLDGLPEAELRAGRVPSGWTPAPWPAAPGKSWEGPDPPSLSRVLFHLLQEYARHVGHLDVVRELVDREEGEMPTSWRA